MEPKLIHQNNGKCQKCLALFSKYPDFNQKLKMWFVMFQGLHPEAHISCAGRGFLEQMQKKDEGRSNAVYGKSAHNYNCAIDLFVDLPGKGIYDKNWFQNVLAHEVPYFLKWYGEPNSDYYELPHIELRDWKQLLATGQVKLVERMPGSDT